MGSVRWVKQQDFCLRIGLLKTIVAIMPRERRGVFRDDVLTKLDKLLFRPLSGFPELWRSAATAFGGNLEELLSKPRREQQGTGPAAATSALLPFHSSQRLSQRQPKALVAKIPISVGSRQLSVADGLLLTSGSSSWGQPIDSATKAKILEWAQGFHLVGAGNQVTERALLLRHLMADEERISRFVRGEPSAWNPFHVTGADRLFFFYHLGEMDQVLWDLAYAVGAMAAGTKIEAEEARRLTAAAMQQLVASLELTKNQVQLLELRGLRGLTKTVVAETQSTGRTTKRTTKKNADHQAIPRCEILVDLGFLEKHVGEGVAGRELDKARSGWSFYVTPAATRFTEVMKTHGRLCRPPWQWELFAQAFGATGMAGTALGSRLAPVEAFQLFMTCYEQVARKAGNTPFESVALLTVFTALTKGSWIEVSQLHGTLRELKRTGALADHVAFAGGNEIDKMFLSIKPGFRRAIEKHLRDDSESGGTTAGGGKTES